MKKSLLYLNTPSNSVINPPIDSTTDNLPIERLSWEDFEKLCLRIAQIEHGIDDCDIYGIKGEKQDGIDIFGRKISGKYTSYQCKRYVSVTNSTLNNAVKEFKEQEWFIKSDVFVFCTTFSLNKASIQSHFETLKDELVKVGITFLKWDKIKICHILKDHPKIVYDFFGREWVKLFNGEEKFKTISNHHKLDANEVSKLRKELYAFYSAVFNNHDSGIGLQELRTQSFLLQERFIMPDTYENNYDHLIIVQGENDDENAKKKIQNILDICLPDSYQRNNVLNEFIKKQDNVFDNFTKNRVAIDSVLVKSKKSIILGDPGSGKSTLLRNLVLDILEESPRFQSTAQYWSNHLPIWLPFAFITKNISANNNLSISELLKTWFSSHDKEHLFDLIKDALSDERLLLVIDGVDELTNKSSAEQAISKIEIHSNIANTSIIYSSRPFGYKMLKTSFPKINELHLLPFSESQQKKYIFYWYEKWLISMNINDSSYAKTQTSNFYNDLENSSELKNLAENPLLLSILITQKLRDSILPSNKLKALETITEHLINIHPKKRTTSANITDIEKFNFDLIEIFEELAIHIQKNMNDGVIDKSEAKCVIENYLKKHLAYQIPEAKKCSEEIFNIGANHYGIIIEKSSSEIAFTHRLFQEFLAARYMYNTEGESEGILSEYGGNPLWYQVFKLFFAQISQRKIIKFNDSVELLGKTYHQEDQNNAILLLKYDVVLTLSNSPVDLSKRYFNEIITLFEYETNTELKKNYWNIILNSLLNSKIKNEVKNYLFRYFPNYYSFDDYRIEPLKKILNLSQYQKEFLIKTLINGNSHQKLDASYVIKKKIKDEWLYSKIIEILDKDFESSIIPFALNCLISEEIDIDIKKFYIKKFKNTEQNKISLFVYKMKVHLKMHNLKDLNKFLQLQNSIDYKLRDEITQIFIDGWPTSKILLEECLNSSNRDTYRSDSKINNEISWKVMLHCFHNKDIVLDKIIDEFSNQEFPFSGFDTHNVLPIILNYFKDNERLMPVIEEWIYKQIYNEPEIAYASLIGRSEKVKKHLMKLLPKASFPHWITMALIEGWRDDKKVILFLKKYFLGNNKNINYSSHYIDIVFKDDKITAIKILEKIIYDRASSFRTRAIKGLINLDKEYFRINVLENFINNELQYIKQNFWENSFELLYTIAQNFKTEPVVKETLFQRLKSNPLEIHLIIELYPEELEIIDEILNSSRPLETDYRLELIEKFSEQGVIDDEIRKHLAKSPEESDYIIKSTASLIYFNELKHIEPQKIISICKENIFYRGHNFDVQRQIAFCGYLIANKLPDYFIIREEDTLKFANPGFSYSDYDNKISEFMIKLLVENFEYLNTVIGGDYTKIIRNSNKDEETHWGFWASFSNSTSQTNSYIMEYIKANESTLTNIHLINYLNRTSSNNSLLKNICLRIIKMHDNKDVSYFAAQILAKKFNDDNNIFKELIDINGFHINKPKILALCIGWPSTPILKEAYEELKDERHINRHLGYNLKFLFRDVTHVGKFLSYVVEDYNGAQHNHQYFIKPLLKRIYDDVELQKYLRSILLTSKSPSIKTSFFALLESANKVDDEILDWKKSETKTNVSKSYGYNILTNELAIM